MGEGTVGDACSAGDTRARGPDPGRAVVPATVPEGPDGPTREQGHPTTVADLTAEARRPDAPSPPVDAGGAFGDYELLGELGAGGMGAVYRARQVSLGRMVALKLIRPGVPKGPADLRRFRNEAEVVAAMDHPNIVPIYEVGHLGGVDYFSMKLVEGRSLDRRLKQLSGDYRRSARLAAEVADAVDHAHRRGVLHRDLKPANILIDEDGRPLVTDFGLAKRLSSTADLTASDAIVGTPAYMAPEQAEPGRGGLTTAADIYGVGAILYALLAGEAPFRGSGALDVLLKVRHEPPAPPSRADRRVPRDLEVICLKCLEKDPARRYHSAEALALDLRRWLDGLPIAARRVGPGGRARLWCRRKPWLAGLSAALAVAVVGGMGGVVVNWLEVLHQKDLLARSVVQIGRERDTSVMLSDFLTKRVLSQAAANGVARRAGMTVEELLDEAAGRVGAEFQGRPKLEAALRETIGDAYRSLGKYDKAEAHLVRALDLRRDLPPEDEPDRLASIQGLAMLRLDQDRLDEALDLARRALEGRSRLLGDGDPATLESANGLARVLWSRGDDSEAVALLRKALADCSASLPRGHPAWQSTLANLAALELRTGRLAEAEASFDRMVAPSVEALGTGHPETIILRFNLAVARRARGQLDRATALLEAVHDEARHSLGEDHHLTLKIAASLGMAWAEGNDPRAEPLLARTLAAQRRALGPSHADALETARNLAVTLDRRGDFDGAERLIREAIAAQGGPDDAPARSASLLVLLNILVDAGNLDPAEALLRSSFPDYRGPRTPPHPLRAELTAAHARLALERCKQGRSTVPPGELVAWTEELVADREARMPPGAWEVASARTILAAALAERRDFERAERLLTQACSALRDNPSTPAIRLEQAVRRGVRLYQAWGRPDDLARWSAAHPRPLPPR